MIWWIFWVASVIAQVVGFWIGGAYVRRLVRIERNDEQREREKKALRDLESAMRCRESEEVRALLACRGESLPERVRSAAETWLAGDPDPAASPYRKPAELPPGRSVKVRPMPLPGTGSVVS